MCVLEWLLRDWCVCMVGMWIWSLSTMFGLCVRLLGLYVRLLGLIILGVYTFLNTLVFAHGSCSQQKVYFYNYPAKKEVLKKCPVQWNLKMLKMLKILKRDFLKQYTIKHIKSLKRWMRYEQTGQQKKVEHHYTLF